MARRKSASKSRKKRMITQSMRAGLTFPVGRLGRLLREKKTKRVGRGAPVFAAAVLEYLCAEFLELSGNICKSKKKKRIQPRHIVLALQDDDELRTLMQKGIFMFGGVIPAGIHPALIKRRCKDYKKGEQFSQAV